MGTSASTEQKEASPEQREVEALAASTGALPLLHKAFASLADHQENTIPLQSLQECFSIRFENTILEPPGVSMPDSILGLLRHLGPSIVDLYFVPEGNGLNWIEFVRGYISCCGRMVASASLMNLLRVFEVAAKSVGLAAHLGFESDGDDSKVAGHLTPTDVYALLMMCWSMSWNTRAIPRSQEEEAVFCVPDIENLVLSAVASCAEDGASFDLWNCDVFSLQAQIPAGKFLSWALSTIPRLPDCFSMFVYGRLQRSVALEQDESGPSSSSPKTSNLERTSSAHILTHGKAWAISLTFKGAASEEIARHCFPCNGDDRIDNLLYCSSIHGKGLNRFWANVEGYHGPLLMLIAASCEDSHHDTINGKKWTIGAITQGLENKDQFYGTPGNLYSLDPVFNVFLPSGKENNFVYSRLHPSVKVYEPRPKPVGIAFGGSMGNERVFIDEDFSRVTIRHHAVDKTYKPGPLFPDQGFLPVDASILEAEVWGLGGTAAKAVQTSYKKREQLFTEQRRKVDLKTFASWEDSPEKMMMDMVSDPNRVQREDR